MTLPGGGYSGSALGRTNVDVFVPELWSDEIKRERDTNFVMKSTVSMLPMTGKKGDVIHIPEISRLAVNDKVHNQPVTLQSRTEDEFTLTIDKYKESSVMIEDIVNVQSKYNLRREYVREMGYALARDCDNFLLGLRANIQGYNSQSNVIYVTSDATSSGTPLSINRASILAAMQLLDEADVPQEGRFLTVSPAQHVDLLTINEFISADYVNNKPTVSGMIGSVYGIPVYKSTQIKANSTTGYTNGAGSSGQPTPGVTNSPYFPTQSPSDAMATTLVTTNAMTTAVMGHKDWAKLSMQLNPRTESSRENLFQADAVISTQIYGAKVYRPDHCVLIYTA
jgi:N4-gp56 family major capsid protein